MGASRGESAASHKVLPVAPTFLGYSGLPGCQGVRSPSEGHPELGVPGRMQASVEFCLYKSLPQLPFCSLLYEDPAAHSTALCVHRGAYVPGVYRQKPRVIGFWCHGPLDAGGTGCIQHTTPTHIHTPRERESCLCVPQVGDRPGSHDINPPLGPSPAGSKGLESAVEPNLHPHTPGTGHPVHEWVGGQ